MKSNRISAVIIAAVGIIVVLVIAFQLRGRGSAPRPVDSAMTGHESSSIADGNVSIDLLSDSASFASGTVRTLKFRLSDAQGSISKSQFEATHEKLLHLVVVDTALADFRHVHPEVTDDGTWSQAITFAKGGNYLVFADGKLEGGSSFVARRELKVAGEASADPANFDLSADSKSGTLAATILNPKEYSVGADSMIQVKLSVADGWEQYLGAPGHLILISQDGTEFIHAHPTGMTKGVAEFMATFKNAGVFRAWAQFQREGQVVTFPFTIKVNTSKPAKSASSMSHMNH